MIEFDAKFGELVEAFRNGKRFSHSKWFPNTDEKYKDLGNEFSFIIANDGNLADAHQTTTYVIFRHTAQYEAME